MHGTFTSADATALSEANGRFSLFAELGVAALTLGSSDVVVITDITVASAATNATITVYDGANNAAGTGEIVWKGIVPTNNTQNIQLKTPHHCQKGTYPKLISSAAGQIDACIKGTVYRVGS